MTTDPATADAATAPVARVEEQQAAAAAADGLPSKIDPITAVQDSIDGLALSLFEALRGVRDAVAPESLATPGAHAPSAAAAMAFGELNEDLEKDATPRERLMNGIRAEYFPPRAFDLLEPDHDAFVVAYLSDNPYARELADRFAALASAEAAASGADPPPSTGDAGEAKEIKLGDVGYEFRKKFDAGWYTGKVNEIRPLAANGYTRRCVYSDGDMEDLRLEDLEQLAQLDPNHKNRTGLSIKVDNPKISNTSKPKIHFPLTQVEYEKLLLDSEHQRDVRTTQLLARDILAKSAAVDDLVAKLPGMNRTRKMQMERIEELIESNHAVMRELEGVYAAANRRREDVRAALREGTCRALGVEEDA